MKQVFQPHAERCTLASETIERMCHRMIKQTRYRRPMTIAMAVLALGVIVGASAATAIAQELTNAFGGFAASPDQPIDIQARRLDVDDKAKKAVFTGNVVAKQDTFTMNSSTLDVHYAARSGAKKKAAGSLGGGSTEIVRLVARGKVFIKSAKREAQTATGDWAEFDVKKRIITMGNVVTLKQGKNVIRGTKLVINLNTGRSSVLSSNKTTTNSSGRIRMVITPDKKLRQRANQPTSSTQKQKPTTSASDPFRGTGSIQ